MFENIKNKRNPLGVELVNAGVITEDALDQALKYQKEHPDLKIGEIVDILNLCPKEQLLEILSKKLGERAVILENNVDIDYATYEAHTTFGVIGVKVWICKGEILNKKSVTTDNTSDVGGEALC